MDHHGPFLKSSIFNGPDDLSQKFEFKEAFRTSESILFSFLVSLIQISKLQLWGFQMHSRHRKKQLSLKQDPGTVLSCQFITEAVFWAISFWLRVKADITWKISRRFVSQSEQCAQPVDSVMYVALSCHLDCFFTWSLDTHLQLLAKVSTMSLALHHFSHK